MLLLVKLNLEPKKKPNTRKTFGINVEILALKKKKNTNNNDDFDDA